MIDNQLYSLNITEGTNISSYESIRIFVIFQIITLYMNMIRWAN